VANYYLYANQATTTVTAGGTDAPSSGTVQNWTVASSTPFPAANSGASPPTVFVVADQSSSANSELILVTNVSGTTWTVTRGAESTTPVAHTSGFTIYAVATAASLGAALQSSKNLSDVASTSAALANLGGMANPMTTPGDIIYESSGTAPARLAGNATVARQFLASQGNGSAAQAPSWGTLAASDVPNPMTTLGDTIYGGASGAQTRLAGNTTTTREFLVGQGNGSTAQAPSWGTIASGDLPTGTTSARGALQLDGAASDFQPDGPASPGSTGKAADGGHAHPMQPWQFQPESYGAKGDGKVIGDVVTNGTTTITSASAAFTAGDVGKAIMVNGANGATSGPLLTTIASVTNSTTVVLAAAAGATATACSAVYGTDDTASINSAVTAASNFAQGISGGPGAGFGDYFAEVLFAAKIYMLAAAPAQTGNGSSTPTFNSQIPLPYPAANGQTRKLVVSLRGAGNAGQLQFWESTVPNLQGTSLVSTQTAPLTPNATFGEQSVIGGPSGSAGFTGAYANTKLYIDGITVWFPFMTNMYVCDFGYLSAVEWGSWSVQGFAPANNTSGAAAAHPYLADALSIANFYNNTIGVGVRFPMVGNNDDVAGNSLSVEGILTCTIFADHFSCNRLATLYCSVGGRLDLVNGISGDSHQVVIPNWSVETYQGALTCNGGGGSYATVHINLDTEPPGGADPTYDISDSGNCLHGAVSVCDNGARTNRRPVVSGAGNLKIVNDMMGPGYWSGAPAVPATTVAQQNTAWRDATVYVNGTLTGNTQVDGHTLGVAATVVRVPAGHTITLTYSSAPTWVWVLD
jgi:hypothetical protein